MTNIFIYFFFYLSYDIRVSDQYKWSESYSITTKFTWLHVQAILSNSEIGQKKLLKNHRITPSPISARKRERNIFVAIDYCIVCAVRL